MKPATVCHQHKASSLSLIVPFPSFRCDSKRTDRVDLQYTHEQELVRFERGLKQFQCMVSRTWDTWLKYTWMEEYIRLFLLIKDRRSCHFCRDPSPLFISLLILYIPDDIRGIRWKRARWPINSSWAGLGWAGRKTDSTSIPCKQSQFIQYPVECSHTFSGERTHDLISRTKPRRAAARRHS